MRLSPLLLLALLGCDPKEPEPEPDDDTGTPTDTGTELACPEGEIPDGDVCVPEACGVGPWGDLEVDSSTVYVDAAVETDGDGSVEAPYGSIQAALDAVAGGAGPMVAVAAGNYLPTDSLDIVTDHAGLHLAGRCRELVTIDLSQLPSNTPGFQLYTNAAKAELSGMTIAGGGYAGLMVWAGDITFRGLDIHGHGYSGIGVYADSSIHPAELLLEDCDVYENTGVNIGIHESRSEVTIRDSAVRDGVRGSTGQNGVGILAKDGASLLIESSTISGNRSQGLYIQTDGTTVVVRDSVISDGVADPSGDYGMGVQITGGSLEIASSQLLNNRHAAISAGGEGVWLSVSDTTIQDTQPTDEGLYGAGIQVADDAAATVDGCELVGNHWLGLLAGGQQTVVTVTDTIVRDTQTTGSGDEGAGLWAQEGATLNIDGGTVLDNPTTGIYAGGEGTTVTVTDTVVQGTRPDDNALYGNAFSASEGASLIVSACTLEDNTGLGILATDQGTTVSLEDIDIIGTQRGEHYTVSLGVGAQVGATIDASNVTISGTQGPALYAAWQDTVLTCTDCTVQDSEFAGLVVLSGAQVSLSGSTIQGTTPASNLGGGVGVYAEPWDATPPLVELIGCEVSDNPIAGLWLMGEGSYLFEDNDIHGGEGETRGSLQRCGDAVFAADGVTSWDGETGLNLVDNTLQQGRGAGLFLDNASATLSGNTLQDNVVDLIVQGEACDALPVGAEQNDFDTVELCPSYDYSTCGDVFTLLLQLSDPESTLLLPPPPPTNIPRLRR